MFIWRIVSFLSSCLHEWAPNQHLSALINTETFLLGLRSLFFRHCHEKNLWWTLNTSCLKCKDTEYLHGTTVMSLYVPFAGGIEAGTAESVPGAVGVSGEAAVGASRAVSVTTVQGDLRDPELRADVQLLLQSKQFKCQPPCLS